MALTNKTLGLKVLPVETLHQSTLGDFQLCPRYGAFRHLLGLRRKGTKRAALDIGTLLHAHAEEVAGGETKKGAVRTKLKAMRTKITKELPVTEHLRAFEELEDNKNLAAMMSEMWFEKYPFNPKWKILAVEQKVRASITELSLDIEGTLDLVLLDDEDGIWVDDYKSCSESPAERAETIPFEWQTMMYPILAAQWCTENRQDYRRVRGIMHSLIQKPGIRLCSTDEKAYERGTAKSPMHSYCMRARDWYNAKGEYAKDADEVAVRPRRDRSTTQIPANWLKRRKGKWSIAAWDEESQNTIEQWACRLVDATDSAYVLRLERWERVRSSCRKWRAACDYLDLCRSNPKVWPALIEQRYAVEKDGRR